MKTVRMVLGSIVIAVGIGCLLLAFLAFRDDVSNSIRKAMNEQKSLYMKGDYAAAFEVSSFLVDSLRIEQDQLKLNHATAAYLAALRDSTRREQRPDTTNTGVKNFFTYMDASLATSKDLAERSGSSAIASTAYNHMGVIVCKRLSADQPEEQVLTEAVAYFKDALQKDEENDHARFNYELAQRKLLLPEIVIAQVKSLINQRKYRQARLLLEKAVRHDNRVKKNYGDFVNRIDNIIKIDSLSRS
jgi:tetratricopeptide (TPR) repeat protein